MADSRLKIFTRQYSSSGRAGHVPMLSPLLGDHWEDERSLNFGQFASYMRMGRGLFSLVDRPEDCDVCVLSIPWKSTFGIPAARAFADECIAEAGRAGKRIIIFFDADDDYPCDWAPHAVVLRFSIYDDSRKANEFAQPLWSQDFSQSHAGGKLPLRGKAKVPSVGFCGYAPPLNSAWGQQKIKDLLKYALYRGGFLRHKRGRTAHTLRAYAIRCLQSSPHVTCNFIIRGQFAFNKDGVLQPGGTRDSAQAQRDEFVANLIASDYVLCTRGLANCSIRLYEALSLGRIPVIVNTNCVMPYDFLVPWRSFGVWVEESDVKNIGRIIAEYHARLSEAQFVDMQQACRRLYEQWICPEGFFRNIALHWQR
jgi:hypothetical protein